MPGQWNFNDGIQIIIYDPDVTQQAPVRHIFSHGIFIHWIGQIIIAVAKADYTNAISNIPG